MVSLSHVPDVCVRVDGREFQWKIRSLAIIFLSRRSRGSKLPVHLLATGDVRVQWPLSLCQLYGVRVPVPRTAITAFTAPGEEDWRSEKPQSWNSTSREWTLPGHRSISLVMTCEQNARRCSGTDPCAGGFPRFSTFWSLDAVFFSSSGNDLLARQGRGEHGRSDSRVR